MQTKALRNRSALSKASFLVACLLSLAGCASAQHMDHHSGVTSGTTTADPYEQEWAKARLAKSPRHQEWVNVKHGDRTVSAFIVYPEVKTKATAVVVIHEINGLTEWVQSLTDQLAEAGYVAIAPDLLSGMAPKGGGTSEYGADRDAVGKAIRALPPDQVTADLNAVADYVAKLPAANGKITVAGFCWGGSQSFRFATNRPDLKAAFVFYGSAPETKEELARIKAPVYGFYAGNDARINQTLPKTIELMKELGKKFEPVTYEGAGHAFMRSGDAPEPKAAATTGDKDADAKAAEDYQKSLTSYQANKKARDESWVRWKSLLGGI
ncbi:MAG TPA: dienelactone hydrolase family protein [Pyrinomonadaceae bacterium]|nr:dienelactone hydrolase family protein [Pyrinomonadaceae bacterium]